MYLAQRYLMMKIRVLCIIFRTKLYYQRVIELVQINYSTQQELI